MPHADSSYFPPGSSKAEVYEQVLEQTRGLVDGQRNWISNLANVSSLLWHAYASLPPPLSSVNWSGFYVRADKFPTLASPVSSTTTSSSSKEPSSSTSSSNANKSININPTVTTTITTTYATAGTNQLLLGPFHGKPACQRILFGKGVCGTAAEKRESVVADDVLAFPGHIACDAESRSEIVVPILVGGETVAIIDVDCTETSGFDDVDKKYLEALAGLLAEACDW